MSDGRRKRAGARQGFPRSAAQSPRVLNPDHQG